MADKQKDEKLKSETENNKKEEKEVIDEKQQELDEITDRYKRVLAEFENFKKRSQKEREGLYNSILSDVIDSNTYQ